MTTEVYLRRSEFGSGPFAIEDIREAASTGALQQCELCWCRGLGRWVPVYDLLQFAEQTEPSRPLELDQLTYARGALQPPSEEVFFARLARTFTYQLKPLYVPFAELRKWMKDDDAYSGTTSTLSEEIKQVKHQTSPVTIEYVLTGFAKASLFFSYRTATGFAFAVRDCTPLAAEVRLPFDEILARFLNGPLAAFTKQGSIASEVFDSGDPEQLKAWLTFCFAELANKPPELVNDASVLCFGTGSSSVLISSCAEDCKAAAREFIEFATETIRLFDKRFQSARHPEEAAAINRRHNDKTFAAQTANLRGFAIDTLHEAAQAGSFGIFGQLASTGCLGVLLIVLGVYSLLQLICPYFR